jgi:hypothetical protein
MTPGSDTIVRIGMMLVRLGFAVALVLGLSILTGIGPGAAALPVHIGAGLLALVGSTLIYLRIKLQGYEGSRSAGIVLLALLIGAGNGILAAIGLGFGLLHLGIMLLAMAGAESAMARLKRG